jgi:predicted RNA binding protein YcfA (HicA-like mRNA interferase family)
MLETLLNVQIYAHKKSGVAMETNTVRIIKRQENKGWVFYRHGAGQDIYRHPVKGFVQVPRHRNLSPGVSGSISKKAGWGA